MGGNFPTDSIILENISKISAKNKGFTLVELIVVMAIMGILLAMSAPFVSATRSEISMNRTIRVLRTDLVTNLGYAMAGKSIAALSADALLDPEKIPGYYGLYFQKTGDYGDLPPYLYLEFHPAEEEGWLNVSYLFKKEWASPEVYLKEILLSKNDDSQKAPADAVLVLFAAPFARVHFFPMSGSLIDGNRLNLKEALLAGRDLSRADFVFQYKDDPLTETVLSFDTNKIISIN